MRYRKSIFASLLIITSLLFASCESILKSGIRYDIDFGTITGDHWDISEIEVDYDVNILMKKIPQGSWNVYKSISIKDYAEIAGKFGFTENQIVSRDSDSVSYRAENDTQTRRLIVWSTGRFSYDTGTKQTSFETTLSKEDCIELSKDVIREYGLTSNMFDDECTVSETVLTTPSINESKITGYTIHLYFLFDGIKMLGEPRLNIKFNGNGEVVRIMYNMPDYQKIGPADIKTLEQALTSIEQGATPMMYGLDEAPNRISINDVELCYYSQSNESNEAIAQPVYLFSATGHYEYGDEPFNILVQAN